MVMYIPDTMTRMVSCKLFEAQSFINGYGNKMGAIGIKFQYRFSKILCSQAQHALVCHL